MFGKLKLDENFELESFSHINCGGSFSKDFGNVSVSKSKSDCEVGIDGFDLKNPLGTHGVRTLLSMLPSFEYFTVIILPYITNCGLPRSLLSH